MTFAPTKKTSKSRSGQRTKNWVNLSARKLLNRVSLQYENGVAVGLSHFAKEDWTYNGRFVYRVKNGSKKVTRI